MNTKKLYRKALMHVGALSIVTATIMSGLMFGAIIESTIMHSTMILAGIIIGAMLVNSSRFVEKKKEAPHFSASSTFSQEVPYLKPPVAASLVCLKRSLKSQGESYQHPYF